MGFRAQESLGFRSFQGLEFVDVVFSLTRALGNGLRLHSA